MAAIIQNFLIEQGIPFSETLTFENADHTPYDFTEHTFQGQIRTCYSSANVVAEFTFDSPEAGKLVVSLTAEQTAAIPVDPAITNTELRLTGYIYDVKIIKADGEPIRQIQGAINVSPQVTR